MYNFAGIQFKIISESGIFFLLGIAIVLLTKPWINGPFHGKAKIGWVSIAVGLIVAVVYLSRILIPQVSVHNGELLYERRTNEAVSILPVTYEYIFDNGEMPKKVLILDAFSMEEIYPGGLSEGKRYSVHYDEFTNVIVRIEENVPEQ